MTNKRYSAGVLFLIVSIFAIGCGPNFPDPKCQVCGNSTGPNIIIGFEDLREKPMNTLKADIRVETKGGEEERIYDLNDKEYGFDLRCPVYFPKRLNCQYGFYSVGADKEITVKMEVDNKRYEQTYSTESFARPCNTEIGYIKITRDDFGYHLAADVERITECEENP